ncbi:MAG: winged helix-turn-helix transcriptional regulator [Acidimicrobiales bacterium]
MKRKSFENMNCPIAQSLEVIGEWWTPLILRDIVMVGFTRFDDIQSNLGIAPTVLTSRLRHLVEAGLVERRQYSEHPPRYDYLPTQAAREFEPVLQALFAWGSKWAGKPQAHQLG